MSIKIGFDSSGWYASVSTMRDIIFWLERGATGFDFQTVQGPELESAARESRTIDDFMRRLETIGYRFQLEQHAHGQLLIGYSPRVKPPSTSTPNTGSGSDALLLPIPVQGVTATPSPAEVKVAAAAALDKTGDFLETKRGKATAAIVAVGLTLLGLLAAAGGRRR